MNDHISHKGSFLLAFLLLIASSLLLASCSQKPLYRPTGIAALPDGTVFIVDRGNYRVIKMDSAENRVTGSFGKQGGGSADLYRSWDIAVNSDGNLFVCNIVPYESNLQSHDGIKVFDQRGNFLKEIGGKNYTDQEFSETPYGIDIDQKDRIYTVYAGPSTLRIFGKNGELLGTYFGEIGSKPGQFDSLNDVAVDDQRNLVYLVDQANSVVQQFERKEVDQTIELVYTRSIGTYGHDLGQLAYPSNLAIDDATGRLYVGDMANERIEVFDSEGKALFQFAPTDTKTWQVLGLSINGGKVFAVDTFNNVVWVFSLDGQLLSKLEVRL